MALKPLLPGNLLQVPSAGTSPVIPVGGLVQVPGFGWFPQVGNNVQIVTNSDPLAGLPFFNRFQTHVPGSNVPFGLYKDTGCTTPATSEGDNIDGVNSGTFGVPGVMVQNSGQPTLHFDSGVPTVLFLASSFVLPTESALTELEGFFLVKNTVPGDGANIFGFSGGGGVDPATYIPFSGSGGIYDSFGVTAPSTRKDNIPASVPSGYFVYNVSSKTGAGWRNALNGTELFSDPTNTTGFGSAPMMGGSPSGPWTGGSLIALFLFSPILTLAQRSSVNGYLTSLEP